MKITVQTQQIQRAPALRREIDTTLDRQPRVRQSVRISDWKSLDRGGPLKSHFTVTLASGLILCECSYFEQNGKRWVFGPHRQYRSGEKVKYAPLLQFVDPATRERFNQSVLAAIDQHSGAS